MFRCKVKWMKRTLTRVILLKIVLFILLYNCWDHLITSSVNNFTYISSKTTNDSSNIILYWTPFFDKQDYYFGFGQKPFVDNHCSVSNCIVSNNRSLLLQAKAVVFHIWNVNPKDLPRFRLPNQRYIFLSYESPMYTITDLSHFKNYFNWTISYRLDSDVSVTIQTSPRGFLSKFSNQIDLKRKSRLAVWLVSHCWTYSHREEIVKILKNYIEVDVYGDCGTEPPLPCSRNPSATHESCMQYLDATYKFYISFENSICKDYLTEKLFNPLQYNLVPIVFGGISNSWRFIPPHSIIDVNNFTSPKELADYLSLLDTNDTLYKQYFDWKKSYQVEFSQSPWCNLCSKLNDINEPKKTYSNIKKWWVDDGQCKNALHLPQINQGALTKYLRFITDNIFLFFRDFYKNFVKIFQ